MEFISKHKRFFLVTAVILCIIISVITINFRYKPTFIESALGYVITPIQKVCTNVGDWVAGKVNFFVNLNEIENTNITLLATVESLEAENKRLRLVEEENKKLSALLEIDQKYAEYPKVGAEIIAKDPGNWYKKFTINKGSNSGLQKDMVVLASGGLVGIIVESGPTYSKVISLIDSTSSISAMSIRTEDIGYVKGDLELMAEGYCRMEHIDLKAEIMEGDEIVTSQLSDLYPPGITIGIVKNIQIDNSGLTKYAIIEPVVDFKHLQTVLVLNRAIPNMSEKSYHVEKEE